MSKRKHQKKNRKEYVIAIVLLLVILICVFIFFLSQGSKQKPDAEIISGKNKQEFKDYTYICAFQDDTGWNTTISEQYGAWALTACSCSYIEYRKYYGDKELPKAKTFIGEFPNLKGVEVYDALSIFGDNHIKSKIATCIEKEMTSHE